MSSIPSITSISSTFAGLRVLLGVTGGIAAYKSADLCRLLIKAGAEVQVIMTESATRFVAPLTFETLSRRPVYRDVFDRTHGWEIEHVAYAHWGDVLVVAPATANTLAKMAAGLADDALSTTVLAFRGPVVVAPAMNTAMWDHAQTRENLRRLAERGVVIVQPGSGELACGDEGAGRLADLVAVLHAVARAVTAARFAAATSGGAPRSGEAGATARADGPLAGRSVLVTAGPTVEPIDPVRFLSNPSSGRMGFALAAEAARRGARVTLVAGPTPISPPEGLAEVARVGTAAEMCEAVLARLSAQDYCVFTAAVADYAPEAPATEKIKKRSHAEGLTLRLVPTPDVAARANAARRSGQTFVGFAAETNEVVANAREKMARKGFDFVVANEVSAANPAFGAPDNEVTLLGPEGIESRSPRMSKEALAIWIWDQVLGERG